MPSLKELDFVIPKMKFLKDLPAGRFISAKWKIKRGNMKVIFILKKLTGVLIVGSMLFLIGLDSAAGAL